MRRLVAPVLLALVLPALLSSCGSHLPPSGLAVELLKLEHEADGSVKATLQIDNSAVLAFNIASSKHQLFLDGRLAGTIEINEPLGMPAQHNLIQTGTLKLAPGGLPVGPASYRLDSMLTLLLYADTKEIDKVSSTGTVQVH